jgi:hypothetical protein
LCIGPNSPLSPMHAPRAAQLGCCWWHDVWGPLTTRSVCAICLWLVGPLRKGALHQQTSASRISDCRYSGEAITVNFEISSWHNHHNGSATSPTRGIKPYPMPLGSSSISIVRSTAITERERERRSPRGWFRRMATLGFCASSGAASGPRGGVLVALSDAGNHQTRWDFMALPR